MLWCVWILLLPGSTVRTYAKDYIAAFESGGSEHLTSSINHTIIATEAAMVSLAEFFKPEDGHLFLSDWTRHHLTLECCPDTRTILQICSNRSMCSYARQGLVSIATTPCPLIPTISYAILPCGSSPNC